MNFQDYQVSDIQLREQMQTLFAKRKELFSAFVIENCPLGAGAIIEKQGIRLKVKAIDLSPGYRDIEFLWRLTCIRVHPDNRPYGKKREVQHLTANLEGIKVIQDGKTIQAGE